MRFLFHSFLHTFTWPQYIKGEQIRDFIVRHQQHHITIAMSHIFVLRYQHLVKRNWKTTEQPVWNCLEVSKTAAVPVIIILVTRKSLYTWIIYVGELSCCLHQANTLSSEETEDWPFRYHVSLFKLNIKFAKTWSMFSNDVNTTVRKYSSRAFIWVVTLLDFVGQFRI